MAAFMYKGEGPYSVSFKGVDREWKEVVMPDGTTDDEFCTFVDDLECLLDALTLGLPIEPGTAQWIANMPDQMYEQLANTGLVESRKDATSD